MIEPKIITITDINGTDRNYEISKFPAIQGCEIMEQWPFANMPKLGDYNLRQELSLKLMAYVSVDLNKDELNPMWRPLSSAALINNHIPDWITKKKIEDAMIGYNGGFFQSGWISSFLEESIQKNFPKILKTLMGSLVQLSQMVKQP